MGWNYLFIAMLWVSEAHRRDKGYGSMFLRQAEEKAKAYGCANLFN
jgi:hypothetical protein